MEREKTHGLFSCFRVTIRVILSLFAVVLLFSFLCSRQEKIENAHTKDTSTFKRKTLVKSIRVIVPASGKWTEKIYSVPGQGRWGWNQIPDDWDNIRTLVEIRANGDDNLIVEHGYRDDGSTTAGDYVKKFNRNIEINFVQMRVKGKALKDGRNVYMDVRFYK